MADTVGTGTEHLTAFNPLQFLADSAACFLLEAGNHLLGKLDTTGVSWLALRHAGDRR